MLEEGVVHRQYCSDIETNKLFKKAWNTSKRWLVMRGGTRSGKTTTLAQMAVVWLFTGQFRKDTFVMQGNLSIVRRYRSTLRATVMRDFEHQLDILNLKQFVKINRQQMVFKFGDRWVEFVGADDEQKLHGFKSCITWMNEANELVWDRSVRQLRYRTSHLLVVDFNPSDPYTWVNTELEQKRAIEVGDVDVIISTYKDNPFLTSWQIEEIEQTQHEDIDFWRVYGLGEYGRIMGVIYENATIVPTMPRNLKRRYKTMDFGYPGVTTLIECGLQNSRDLYIDEWFYTKAMQARDLDITFKALGVSKRELIFGDSADQRIIEEMQSRGWKVKGAEKGPGSVEYGIQLVSQYNLFITERSANVIRERLLYKWKTDKNGVNLGVPIKAFDHTWDAIRYYALENLRPIRKIKSSFNVGYA